MLAQVCGALRGCHSCSGQAIGPAALSNGSDTALCAGRAGAFASAVPGSLPSLGGVSSTRAGRISTRSQFPQQASSYLSTFTPPLANHSPVFLLEMEWSRSLLLSVQGGSVTAPQPTACSAPMATCHRYLGCSWPGGGGRVGVGCWLHAVWGPRSGLAWLLSYDWPV